MHPAERIRTDPKKNNDNKKNSHLSFLKNHKQELVPMHKAKIIAYSQ